ncbi:Protein of uncharacterised function (DUF3521) [Escherichia coli]|nr:Protein of uncharacterised function (DUF3521) [Escherichia coli]
MRYAYQAYKGTQLIEFAGFVGQIRRSRRIRHNKRTLYSERSPHNFPKT